MERNEKGQFNKGSSGFKGKHSKETKNKISNFLKGKTRAGNPDNWKHKESTKLKLSLLNTGKKLSKETRLKMGNSRRGVLNCNWEGGISTNPYPKEFNKELKLKIRTRDNFNCCLCGKSEREELEELNRVLCVNHIDFDKNNCKESNLNTLCLRCNIKINRERDYWTNYFLTYG